MGKKNYSCESSDSCSLVSVTGISACSSCSESCSSTPSCSSSYDCTSSSSCCSEQTYSDNTTCKTTECSTKCDRSSTCCDYTSKTCESSSKTCSKTCSKSEQCHSDKCEKHCYKNCEKLVKKYNCAKEELCAISDIIVVLNFLKSKLVAVQPNVDLRDVSKYTVQENIKWMECFVDTVFCVLRKNDAYKIIKVKDCKVKNDSSDCVVDNRTYLIKVKYSVKCKEVCKNIPLVFEWTQLTNNDATSFKGILNTVVRQIDNYITGYQAAATVPFLC